MLQVRMICTREEFCIIAFVKMDVGVTTVSVLKMWMMKLFLCIDQWDYYDRDDQKVLSFFQKVLSSYLVWCSIFIVLII